VDLQARSLEMRASGTYQINAGCSCRIKGDGEDKFDGEKPKNFRFAEGRGREREGRKKGRRSRMRSSKRIRRRSDVEDEDVGRGR